MRCSFCYKAYKRYGIQDHFENSKSTGTMILPNTFQRPREVEFVKEIEFCMMNEGIMNRYTRALNAVKLGRMFAKSFVGPMYGHSDDMSSLLTAVEIKRDSYSARVIS